MKKIVSALLSVAMLSACGAMAVACGKDDEGGDAQYKYNITVWVGEGTKTLTEQMIKDFNSENTQSIYFKATVNEVTESKASGDVMADPESAPEIFCFAQDQLARLVKRGLLATPTKTISDDIKAKHSEMSVSAATVGTTLYAYPLTEDNGYFLYYNKNKITDQQAETVEGIISACEANNHYFSFGLTGEGAGWYVSSFFYGAGAQSEWTTDDNGGFTDYDDTFNSAEGLIAMKGIQKVVSSKSYLKNGKASDFNAATPADAVISGVWDYQAAKNALGDNLGIAKLPTYEVDGQPYQLKSYLGCKLIGVSPQTDGTKKAALGILAQYLSNGANQTKRFEAFGWGPSEKTAQASTAVQSNAALTALKAATVPQGQYPTDWWTKSQTLGLRAEEAKSDSVLQAALTNYAAELSGLLDT